jgi:hypothetical protein
VHQQVLNYSVIFCLISNFEEFSKKSSIAAP